MFSARSVKPEQLPFNLTVLARDSSSTGDIMETSVPLLVSAMFGGWGGGRSGREGYLQTGALFVVCDSDSSFARFMRERVP